MDEMAIEIQNLHVSYREMKKKSIKKSFFLLKNNKFGLKEVLKGISFRVKTGEAIGIIGENGCGKSTLLRTIAGIIAPDKGTVDLKENHVSLLALGVGFNEELTGYENIFLSGMLLGISKENVKEKLDQIIAYCELGEYIYKPVRTYSAGMRSKLAFSITAILESDIILIDEVLSVGDIKFKEKSYHTIRQLIMNKSKTVLIVSHEMNVLSEICDRIIWIDKGNIKNMGKPNEIIQEFEVFMKKSV